MVTHQKIIFNFISLDYANSSEFIDKYMFICLVLDELTFRKYYEQEEEVSIAFLRKRLHKKMSYSLYNRPIAILELWLTEMQVMKLIALSKYKENNVIIITKLTEQGEKAYRKQTYHQIYANLIAERMSRRLAILAIIISVIISTLTLIMTLWCK